MHNTGKLPVMESFYTIQGEGFYSGTPAYFIRTAGCDVACHWCDVKESWRSEDHPMVDEDELIRQAKESGTRLVVITGGEPLMYNLDSLTSGLQSKGLKTNIETSGAYPLSGSWDWVCLSPKKFKRPVESVLEKTNELKVVIFNQSDFDWAEEYAQQLNDAHLYLQPEWSREKEMTPLIVDYVKRNPKWNISLQTHKYMQIP